MFNPFYMLLLFFILLFIFFLSSIKFYGTEIITSSSPIFHLISQSNGGMLVINDQRLFASNNIYNSSNLWRYTTMRNNFINLSTGTLFASGTSEGDEIFANGTLSNGSSYTIIPNGENTIIISAFDRSDIAITVMENGFCEFAPFTHTNPLPEQIFQLRYI